MKTRLLLSLLATSLGVTWLHAADEEDDQYSPELGIYASAKNSVKFGFRMVNGAKVHFGNLGIVPLANPIAPASAGEVDRKYSDGVVLKDAARTNQGFPSSVTPTAGQSLKSTILSSNGRYQTYVTTNTGGVLTTAQTGDFLTYQAGQTRTWRYDQASQLLADNSGIIMNAFSATSEGASFDGLKKVSGGVEFQLERVLGKLGRKWEVSIVGGLALNSILNKQAGNVQSTLNKISDTFLLTTNAAAPAAGSLQPTFDTLTFPDVITVVAGGLETTAPLSTVPIASSHVETASLGGANVAGLWEIKGAYYTMKIGPEIRGNLTKNFGFSASIGVAGAYAGTNYSAVESFTAPGVADPLTTNETSAKNKFMPGYYANLDATWQANERTGFFAGVSYEKFDTYDQSVGGRTAKIDLASTAGIRGGISIKF